MLRLISTAIAGSRAGRYWLSKLSNHEACEPLFNIAANQVAAGLRRLRRAGLSPDLIVDVGAHRGEWTKMALPVFPASRFIMIEAQPEIEPELSRVRAFDPARISYVISLLGADAKEKVEFNLAGTGSSLYSENTSFAQRSIVLSMTTLDSVLKNQAADGKCFLKLDVQGAELDVLAGASRTLARTDAILTEVSLVEYNLGAPRMADVVVRLRELDFLVFDIWDLRRINSTLAQTDLLFVRRGSALELQAADTIRAYGN
jgi:FkbM family methyltransferase